MKGGNLNMKKMNKRGVATPIIIIAIVIIAIIYFGYQNRGSSGSLGSLGDQNNKQNNIPSSSAQAQISCRISSISATTSAVQGNSTFTMDTNDLSHYTIALNNATNAGSGSFNGTLICTRNGNMDQAGVSDCYFQAGSYKNKVSTTDANVYYMVALTSSKSMNPNFPYQQTAYLKSGAVASTTDSQEYLPLVFAGSNSGSPEVQKTLGFYFTLPGSTNVNYLNNLDSVDNYIVCNGQNVVKITIQKISA